MNSFRMSFWRVPESFETSAPCSMAAAMYMPMTGRTAPFIVIETEVLSRGMPSKRIFMSSTLSIATPALPTSPATRGWSES